MPEPLPRDQYLQLVRTGLAARQSTFSRQAILSWLATYPGDLKASLYYARALVAEGRLAQALPVIQGLCRADPEFIEAIEMLLQVVEHLMEESVTSALPSTLPPSEIAGREKLQPKLGELINSSRAHRFALVGESQGSTLLASWGGPLWFARHAIEQGDYHLAETLLQDILSQDLLYPLEAVTHLQYLATAPDISLAEKYQAAKNYYARWPDCLIFMLRLAEWSSEQNVTDHSVALVHQAASRDLEGQVARRIWGEAHPFKALWPNRLELKLELPIPGIVMAMLGWNRLPSETSAKVELLRPEPTRDSVESVISATPIEQVDLEPKPSPEIDVPAEETGTGSPYELYEPKLPTDEPAEITKSVLLRRVRKSHPLNSDLQSVEDELEQLASRLNLAGIAQRDGRFPIYVIFSTRCRLQSVYGSVISDLLESEMEQLAEAVRSRSGWGARVFYADDPSDTLSIGSKPAKPDDPWELKLLLADLDDALAKRGERIGAVLIVGGAEIVPFHCLPNPVDDQDKDIPSDNPYATRDENYFIPEWPVGRLPGGMGNDAHLLLEALRRYRVIHAGQKRRISWYQRLASWISEQVSHFRRRRVHNFGYTAAVWRQAAEAVFKQIGSAGRLHISPPAGFRRQRQDGSNVEQTSSTGVPQISGRLGYFNLHGLVDAPEWFGHGDLLRSANELDYPVALRPEDIQHSTSRLLEIPKVIFSEACYGMHIQDRSLDEAIALRFLDAGSLAVVGSTCMAYGSIDLPLVAADLLAQSFWRFLKEGLPAGEALCQAKIYLASEMHHRQGYLDGEDQKTLISFVLYGDPLAEPLRKERVPKSVRYRAKPIAELHTVCDRVGSPGQNGPVPVDVMDSIRQAVAKYLPGMSDAKVAWVVERDHYESSMQDRPTDELRSKDGGVSEARVGGKSGTNNTQTNEKRPSLAKAYRQLVTLSKQVARSGELHPEIARLTLDEQGKVVKLVVSR